MFEKHKSKKAMRAYLLGSLDERTATELEKRYFAEPAWLALIQLVETEMIRDYLGGRLPVAQKACFEARYLTVPALHARLEEVRKEVLASPRALPLVVRWQVLSLVLVVVISAGVGYKMLSHGPSGAPPAVPTAVAVDAPFLFSLSPGATKGDSSQMATLSVVAGRRVQLRFELPGRTTAATCRVALKLLDAVPGGHTVWRSEPVTSTSMPTGSRVAVELDTERLPSGDYIAEVVDLSDAVLERYLFRARFERKGAKP